MLNQAFFLDRDGVINEEISYLGDPDQLVLLPGIPEAFCRMQQAGFRIVVITNQSGVPRGKFTAQDVSRVHCRLQRELLCRKAPPCDAFYCCFHHPDYTGECSCRKPAPGLLLLAAEELRIDLSRSFMVGDRRSDLYAGMRAGCRKSCLVTTGYGANEAEPARAEGFPVTAGLLDATEFLLHL